ncbi:MAG TPA: DUF4851 domain-containing protein [Candidatus Avidesulfovibrio excrementigallinarum]|nr:DUF4851 domain-containing protein [Candidatus Avidesulfovibrio excrementigallinarum]
MPSVHPFRMLAIGICCALTLACSPLSRGFVQGDLVSSAYPPVTISTSMPVLLEGKCTPFVLVDSSFQFPETWIAVYGERSQNSPMAIAAYSVAPTAMEWRDAGKLPPDGPVASSVDFGGAAFAGSVRIVSADRDPFAPLVLSPEQIKEKGSEIQWLVQRFSLASANSWETKIILEYREPLPEWIGPLNLEAYMISPDMRAFMERAANAFSVNFACAATDVPRAPFIPRGVLNQRYLGQFLGELVFKPEMLSPFDDD